MTRQVVLNVNVLNFGQAVSARQFSGLPPARVAEAEHYVEQARTAERGTLDAFSLAGGPALRERPYTLREVLDEFGSGGDRRIVGSPEEVADTIEERFRAGAADGFNLMPNVFPSGLEDFADHVAPLLRERRLGRHEFAETTLRERWGLFPVLARNAA